MINEARLNKIVNESIKKVLKEEEEKANAWSKFKKAKAAAGGDAKKLAAAHSELEKDLRAAGKLNDYDIADETGPRHGKASSTKDRTTTGKYVKKKGEDGKETKEFVPNPDHDGRFKRPRKK